ncbi:MAG: anti-sigma factor [Chitinophagaceae bacterium]|nr:anti-sigma factor [Chitinophagaceae bacterium]
MNIKEYISSGIVESYVLGLASDQERIEFEKLCRQYPELVAARNEFELKLENQAFEQAIAPPVHLKEEVLGSVRPGAEDKVAPVVRIERSGNGRGWLRFVAAASILLLLATAWFAFDQYSKNRELKNSFSQLRLEVDSVNQILAKQKESMMDPKAAMVVSMVGTQPSSNSSANIYWDTASTNVFLVVKNLPKLPTEKQYQLWAFIDGKPVDLGLFDAEEDKVILKMKNTQKAEAFAITIENRGNGPVPGGPVETYGKTRL